jgi:hypothetical protein
MHKGSPWAYTGWGVAIFVAWCVIGYGILLYGMFHKEK